VPEPDDDDDDFKSAADDPTAMWDDEALRAAGMSHPGKGESRAATPATRPSVGGDSREKVIVGRRSSGPAGPARAASGGLSWPLTLLLAIALGVAVYFLVSYLR